MARISDGITKLNVALLFSNTLRLMCFAGLAVYFNRWWIVLLVCLFWSSGKENDYDKN